MLHRLSDVAQFYGRVPFPKQLLPPALWRPQQLLSRRVCAAQARVLSLVHMSSVIFSPAAGGTRWISRAYRSVVGGTATDISDRRTPEGTGNDRPRRFHHLRSRHAFQTGQGRSCVSDMPSCDEAFVVIFCPAAARQEQRNHRNQSEQADRGLHDQAPKFLMI